MQSSHTNIITTTTIIVNSKKINTPNFKPALEGSEGVIFSTCIAFITCPFDLTVKTLLLFFAEDTDPTSSGITFEIKSSHLVLNAWEYIDTESV